MHFGRLRDAALCGVFEDPDGEWEGYDFSLVATTKDARKTLRKRKSKLPFDRMFAISDDNAGGYYLMAARGEGDAVIWVSEDDYSSPTDEWATFDMFLQELIDRAEEAKD